MDNKLNEKAEMPRLFYDKDDMEKMKQEIKSELRAEMEKKYAGKIKKVKTKHTIKYQDFRNVLLHYLDDNYFLLGSSKDFAERLDIDCSSNIINSHLKKVQLDCRLIETASLKVFGKANVKIWRTSKFNSISNVATESALTREYLTLYRKWYNLNLQHIKNSRKIKSLKIQKTVDNI